MYLFRRTLLERGLTLIKTDFHGFSKKIRENPAPSGKISVPIVVAE